jgi:hypothetical protein
MTMATVAISSPSDVVSPGLLGFLVVVVLGLALWLLLRSMNKHLGRVQSDDELSDDEAVPVVTANNEENGAGHKISP